MHNAIFIHLLYVYNEYIVYIFIIHILSHAFMYLPSRMKRFFRPTFLFRIRIQNRRCILIIDLDTLICVYLHIMRLQLHFTNSRTHASINLFNEKLLLAKANIPQTKIYNYIYEKEVKVL